MTSRDIYAVGPLFIPVIKEAALMRGIIESSVCSFPMPAVTEEQRVKIAQILEREGIVCSR